MPPEHFMKHPLPVITGLVCLFSCALSPAQAEERPNIIYILADDVGYGDLSCYGQKKFQTPNLDRMAAEGMRFTAHYAGACVCAPSRFTLMMGKHIARAHTEGQGQELHVGDRTIANLLQDNGYATAMIGKWGLGRRTGLPNLKGFDVWYGFLDQRRAHFHYPEWVWKNGRKEMLPDNPQTHAQHTQDLFTREALRFIREKRDQPFFLYLPYTLVHAELIVPAKFEEPFLGKLDDKPQETKPYGILKGGYNKPRNRHAAFAGAMSFLDRDIGKIFALLEELAIDEKTLVIFTSDNGPHSEGGADPRYFNSSGGLKRGKGWLYEGGIRVPMIARWPKRIEANITTNHPSWFPDIFPTLAELGGIKPTANDLDGVSLTATLFGKGDQQASPYLYWSHHRQRAVRQGRWKLMRFYETYNDITRYRDELYDLERDMAEQNDLAQAQPEQLKALVRRLNSLEHWK
jgi:arylsulfatase A-like enzyme